MLWESLKVPGGRGSGVRGWLPAIVRGSMLLPGSEPAVLLDATGRRRARLKPGLNDVRGIAPGVYFVATRAGAQAKIVIQR